MSEVVIGFWLRVADALRELDPCRSSADLSFRRRGSVPNLSNGLLTFASSASVPTRVLIETPSGAAEVPLAEVDLGVVVPLPPTDGQRPSSVGVASGVRPRVTEGVLETVTLCSAGEASFSPVGNESGLGGRFAGRVFDFGVETVLVVVLAAIFSRDRARSRAATFIAEVGGVFRLSETERPSEEARDRELLRAEQMLSADFRGDRFESGSFMATFFFVELPPFRSELTGPPVIEELSLPPSLAQ
uniref:(northern house mosquito) hypothetical protein n=1 Tax=Culex pipiens TaxID=7175 RepID=A0A8D8CEN8_CULPI